MLWLQSISILQPDRHLPLTLSLPSTFPFSILINNVFGSMEILKPFRGEILDIGHLDCKNDIIECRNNWCCQPHMWMCQYWTPMFVYICHVLSKGSYYSRYYRHRDERKSYYRRDLVQDLWVKANLHDGTNDLGQNDLDFYICLTLFACVLCSF